MSFEERVKLYKGQTFHDIKICGLNRRLPIRQVSEDLWIASNHQLVLGRDVEFTRVAGKELARLIEKYRPDCLFTAESKSLPLVYKMAEYLNLQMCTARKGERAYMVDLLKEEIKSITTKEPQVLVLEQDEAERMRGKRVAVVDDVVSTYGTMGGLERLVRRAGGEIVGKAAVWLEGPWYREEDLIYLDILPIFVSKQKYHELKREWYKKDKVRGKKIV